MKKIILTLIVLVIGFAWWYQSHKCIVESVKVNRVVMPVIDTFAQYLETHDEIDTNIFKLETLLNSMVSCMKKETKTGCDEFNIIHKFDPKDEKYEFYIDGGTEKNTRRIYLSVMHNTTLCDYTIYIENLKKNNGEVPLNYRRSSCRLKCGTTWWRM